MSLEATSIRKAKRIVEYIISGFTSGKEAITFGNTANLVVQQNVDELIKFRQYIGAPNTELAITEDWQDATVLKLNFMELPNQDASQFVRDCVKTVIKSHMEVHPTTQLSIVKEIVREKPQPQFI